MARYKHQMVEYKRTYPNILATLGPTYKCIFCGYENHTMEKYYPYPEGWEFWGVLESPVHCPKSNIKIKWWERVIGNVNCRLVYCMNKKELKIQQALGIVNDRKERKKR